MLNAKSTRISVTELVCLRCGQEQAYEGEAYLCKICGYGSDATDAGVLEVRYDMDQAKAELLDGDRVRSRRPDMFRYLPLLPVEDAPETLPTGWTPLFPVPTFAQEVGAAALHLKDETRNPTRALKDRATAVGVTRARQHGYTDIACASAGNAAISMSAFAASIGLRAHAYVPHDASGVRLGWLHRLGADVRRSEGDYDQAFDEAEAMREQGWYSRNCAFNPFLVEGKKTAAYEIAEQLGWDVPDFVVAPVGDACTLGAIGKGFRELAELGAIDRLPRLVGVQTAAVHPMVDRFQAGDAADGWPAPPQQERTAAASIDVRRPRNARRLMKELAASDGAMLAVTDEQIKAAQLDLAERAGVVAEFTSAAPLAGVRVLAEHESLAGKSLALVITGGRPDDV